MLVDPSERAAVTNGAEYRQRSPRRARGVVELLWHADGVSGRPHRRILPNGMVELLVNRGETLRIAADGSRREAGHVWMSCVNSRAITVETSSRYRVFGMRLVPEVASAVLGRPMREFSGSTVSLDDVLGDRSRELADRCTSATSVEECFEHAEDWLLERAAKARPTEPAIARAATRIRASGGTVPISTLQRECGFTRARLAKTFQNEVGVTPKLYARIVRLRHSLELLSRPNESLVDVALEAGFCDQPHMNADFRDLADLTPGEFIRAARNLDQAAVEAMGLAPAG